MRRWTTRIVGSLPPQGVLAGALALLAATVALYTLNAPQQVLYVLGGLTLVFAIPLFIASYAESERQRNDTELIHRRLEEQQRQTATIHRRLDALDRVWEEQRANSLKGLMKIESSLKSLGSEYHSQQLAAILNEPFLMSANTRDALKELESSVLGRARTYGLDAMHLVDSVCVGEGVERDSELDAVLYGNGIETIEDLDKIVLGIGRLLDRIGKDGK